jgi:hypothetical protein
MDRKPLDERVGDLSLIEHDNITSYIQVTICAFCVTYEFAGGDQTPRDVQA